MGDHSGDLANFLPRAGATLLDGILIGVLAFVAALIASAAGAAEDVAGWIVIAAALLSTLVYAPLLMSRSGAHNGQTLGKQATSVRVVRQDAQPVGVGLALLREFLAKGLLGLIPFYTIVDYLFPLADSRRQAIHDKIASTFVVRADAVPDLDAWGAGAGGAAQADAFGRQGLERPEVPSGWAPPASTPAPEPERVDWAPPAPAPPAADADDEARGPFGPPR